NRITGTGEHGNILRLERCRHGRQTGGREASGHGADLRVRPRDTRLLQTCSENRRQHQGEERDRRQREREALDRLEEIAALWSAHREVADVAGCGALRHRSRSASTIMCTSALKS